MSEFSFLVDGVQIVAANPKVLVMWVVRELLIWLAIGRDFESTLLLPMGFGTIPVNPPFPDVLSNIVVDATDHATVEGAPGIVTWLFQAGIETSEAFPLLLFVGIGAMIDLRSLLFNPRILLFGDAAQFDISLTVMLAILLGFPLKGATSINMVGTADGPTSIPVSQTLGSAHMGATAVATYSYMALVPVIQPLAVRLVTSKRGRMIRMPYSPESATKTIKTLFPIIATLVAGMIVPDSVALIGFLTFGNLIRGSGRLESLFQTAQGPPTNLTTILLDITITFTMQADRFLDMDTLIVMALGLFAFMFGTIGGVLLAKVLNIFLPQGRKINPIVGGAGISTFPMSSCVIQKMVLKESSQNRLLIHAVGANVAGQIGSVVADGIILSLVKVFLA